MYRLYYEKEKLLEEYYSTGLFPHDMMDPRAKPPRELVHDPLRYLLLHLFFMASSYVFWTQSEGIRHFLAALVA